MKKTIYLLIASSLIAISSCGKIDDSYIYEEEPALTYKQADWTEVADKGTLGLLQFWYPANHSSGQKGGYFGHGANGANSGFNYWLQAQALDVLVDAYNRTTVESEKATYLQYINEWYVGVQVKHKGQNNIDLSNLENWEDNYNDDMEWMCLATLRVYQATGDKRFRDIAQHMWKCIFEDSRAYNESAPYYGGIFWLRSGSGKNACSCGPGSLMSLKMYSEFGDPKYLDFAKRTYEWQRNNLYNQNTGAVYDNMSINTTTGVINVDKVALSYNQGTFLGTALELYKATGDQIYLDDAKKAANYTIGRKITSNGVLSGEGSEQNQVFRGIFIRSFLELTRYENLDTATRDKYLEAMERFGQYIWQVGSASYNIDENTVCTMFSDAWDEAPDSYEFSKQMSGCMLVDAVDQLAKAGLIK